MNRLLDETKDDTWPIPAAVFPGFERLRVQPTAGAILDDARGHEAGRGDFLIRSSLKYALIARIVTGDYRWVYTTLGTLFGFEGTAVPDRNIRDVGCRPPRDGGASERRQP